MTPDTETLRKVDQNHRSHRFLLSSFFALPNWEIPFSLGISDSPPVLRPLRRRPEQPPTGEATRSDLSEQRNRSHGGAVWGGVSPASRAEPAPAAHATPNTSGGRVQLEGTAVPFTDLERRCHPSPATCPPAPKERRSRRRAPPRPPVATERIRPGEVVGGTGRRRYGGESRPSTTSDAMMVGLRCPPGGREWRCTPKHGGHTPVQPHLR